MSHWSPTLRGVRVTRMGKLANPRTEQNRMLGEMLYRLGLSLTKMGGLGLLSG